MQRRRVADRGVLAIGVRIVGARHLVARPAAPGLGAHERRGARMERRGLEHRGGVCIERRIGNADAETDVDETRRGLPFGVPPHTDSGEHPCGRHGSQRSYCSYAFPFAFRVPHAHKSRPSSRVESELSGTIVLAAPVSVASGDEKQPVPKSKTPTRAKPAQPKSTPSAATPPDNDNDDESDASCFFDCLGAFFGSLFHSAAPPPAPALGPENALRAEAGTWAVGERARARLIGRGQCHAVGRSGCGLDEEPAADGRAA